MRVQYEGDITDKANPWVMILGMTSLDVTQEHQGSPLFQEVTGAVDDSILTIEPLKTYNDHMDFRATLTCPNSHGPEGTKVFSGNLTAELDENADPSPGLFQGLLDLMGTAEHREDLYPHSVILLYRALSVIVESEVSDEELILDSFWEDQAARHVKLENDPLR